jgi:hypothetical protein
MGLVQTRDILPTVGALGIAGLAAAGYVWSYRFGRRWCLEWGASGAEARASLPGDRWLPEADVVSTRAVTIHAPSRVVWPWLVQMGPGRGGAYTYDWIERLAGLDMHSADRIVPEWQHLAVGDRWELGPHGATLQLVDLEPARALVVRSDDEHWVWSLVLEDDHGETRLISRNRIVAGDEGPAARAVFRYVLEPGSLVMERKMLRGIKHRAEGTELGVEVGGAVPGSAA